MSETRTIVNQYFQAVREAAPEAIAALFSEDVDWYIPGDVARVPWIGRRTGRAGVAAFFRELRASIESIRVDIRAVLVEGERAVVMGHLVSRVVSTGKLIETDCAIELVVKDGLIAKYVLLEDSFAVVQAVVPDIDPRRAVIETYFRKVDAQDPSIVELFAEDFELFFPKFGRARGKDALLRLGAALGAQLASIDHDIASLHYIVSGDTIAVEGQERGVNRDGTRWPDGIINEGRFCNVFHFDGQLIRRVYIYLDPDFTNADTGRVRALSSPP